MHLTIQSLSKQYRHGFFGLRDFDLEVKPGVIGVEGLRFVQKLRREDVAAAASVIEADVIALVDDTDQAFVNVEGNFVHVHFQAGFGSVVIVRPPHLTFHPDKIDRPFNLLQRNVLHFIRAMQEKHNQRKHSCNGHNESDGRQGIQFFFNDEKNRDNGRADDQKHDHGADVETLGPALEERALGFGDVSLPIFA